MFFYLLFPALLWAVKKIRDERLWWYAIGVAALILLMPLVAQLLPAKPVFGPENTGTPYLGHSTVRFWFVSIFPPVRLLDFVLGILMARIVLASRWINLRTVPAVLLLVVFYGASLFEPWLYQSNSANIIPLALLIPAIATADVQERRSFLRSPVMRRLGEWSYAFYMLHWSLGLWIKLRTDAGLKHHLSATEGIAVIVALFAVTLVASGLLFTLIEDPIMRRWSKPRAARTLPPIPEVVAAEPGLTTSRP
jgi:peptidoglycan/LPS O-acetylase OafA/YrhL